MLHIPPPTGWPLVRGVLVRGHGVASGRSGDPRFPGGTIALQGPHFRARGLDLEDFFAEPFYAGTLNVSIAPHRFEVGTPRVTFRRVRWHPSAPPEDFSFFDARVGLEVGTLVQALVYRPHPDTKPEHEQPPDVLEVLAPYLAGIEYGSTLYVALDPAQLRLV